MRHAPGDFIGSYEVAAILGAGGMGEVYRARDTTLDRDVALKILPERFALDGERLMRFEREARVLATLNHPNIAQIYGVSESSGNRALVMELVGGATLAERIGRGPLPAEEALAIARQVADALEAAHEKGIVHRDLKPGNIKLTLEGTVKVLDFGLAKALGKGAEADPAESPTVTASATRGGVVLGTAAYMSPEQARGRAVDKRTDIWAFGCVLYELLTGQRVFAGQSLSDTMAAVLGREPDWTLLPPALPAAIRRLLQRCLEKDPKRRLHDIADARIELDDAMAGRMYAPAAGDAPARRARYWRALAIAASCAALLLAALAIATRWRGAPGVAGIEWATGNIAAAQLTNYGGLETSAAIAPDGRTFAFVSDHAGTPDIWLRQVSGGEPVRLTADDARESDLIYSPDGETIYFTRVEGTDRSIWRMSALGSGLQRLVANAHRPASSPDGSALAYYTADRNGGIALVVGDRTGGNPRTLARGLTGLSPPRWSRDGGRLSYLQEGLWAPKNLFVVDVERGDVRQVTQFTKADEGIGSHDWLPGNRYLAVSYLAAGSEGGEDLGIFDIQTGSLSRLTFNVGGQSFQHVSLSADGSRLMATSFLHRHGLWKVPLGADPDESGRLAVRVIDDTHDPSWISVSRDGRTLLFAGTFTGGRHAWTMALDGAAEPRQVTATPGLNVLHPAVSPDGTRVTFASTMSGVSDIWLQNVDGSGLRQLTSDAHPDAWPVWSPDGRVIAFQSLRDGRYQAWHVASAGGRAEQLWDGFFRADWIRKPGGNGTWLASWFGGSLRLYDFERRTVVWEKPIVGVGAPVFSPDGRFVSIEAREGRRRSSIWIFEAATGEQRLAVRLPEGFLAEFRAPWVDGGKALLVSRVEEASHVVLFDRFWVPEGSSR